MGVLEFKILSQDDDEMLNLQVKVGSDLHAGTHETYVYPQALEEFGRKLQEFPFHGIKEVILESGSKEPGWYGYLRLRVVLLSGFGRSALEVEHQTNIDPPSKAAGHFYVPGEVASFNRLGAELCKFLETKNDQFRGEWRDA